MVEQLPSDDELRRMAAAEALGAVEPGMKLGLGTAGRRIISSRLLGARVRAGFDVIGVPTSERTAALAKSEGVPLATLDQEPALDLTIDGADEIDPKLRLIKGGGGALLREKIVAAASARMIVIVDAAKLVRVLGAFPLPIEVVPFGLAATRRAIEKVCGGPRPHGAIAPAGGRRSRLSSPMAATISSMHPLAVSRSRALAAGLSSHPRRRRARPVHRSCFCRHRRPSDTASNGWETAIPME